MEGLNRKGWHLIEGPKGGYESGEPDREGQEQTDKES